MFDPSKPVMLRNGNSARILCTDKKGAHRPVVVLYTDKYGNENFLQLYENGTFDKEKNTPWDLINIPEKKKVYINLYENDQYGYCYSSRSEADKMARRNGLLRIRCLEFEYDI